MDASDYIAIATLAMPLAAAVILLVFKREPKVGLKRALLVVGAGALAQMFMHAITSCMCAWSPIRFITIAVICAIACGVFSVARSVRIASFLLFVGWASAISFSAHPGGNTLSLQPPIRTRERQAVSILSEATAVLDRLVTSDPSREFAEGWFHVVVTDESAEHLVGDRPPRDYRRRWHSWLTQLGEENGRRPYGIWYPGGPTKEAVGRLEIRDLPAEMLTNHTKPEPSDH
jgi:hypothetical protein